MRLSTYNIWQRFAARIAISGMLLQAALSAFMLPMPRAAYEVQAGIAAPVCVPGGMIRADGPADKTAPDGVPDACPVCAMLAAAGLALAPSFQALPQSPPLASTGLAPVDEARPGTVVLARHSRGPPFNS
jgi:hypothetical protein